MLFTTPVELQRIYAKGALKLVWRLVVAQHLPKLLVFFLKFVTCHFVAAHHLHWFLCLGCVTYCNTSSSSCLDMLQTILSSNVISLFPVMLDKFSSLFHIKGLRALCVCVDSSSAFNFGDFSTYKRRPYTKVLLCRWSSKAIYHWPKAFPVGLIVVNAFPKPKLIQLPKSNVKKNVLLSGENGVSFCAIVI